MITIYIVFAILISIVFAVPRVGADGVIYHDIQLFGTAKGVNTTVNADLLIAFNVPKGRAIIVDVEAGWTGPARNFSVSDDAGSTYLSGITTLGPYSGYRIASFLAPSVKGNVTTVRITTTRIPGVNNQSFIRAFVEQYSNVSGYGAQTSYFNTAMNSGQNFPITTTSNQSWVNLMFFDFNGCAADGLNHLSAGPLTTRQSENALNPCWIGADSNAAEPIGTINVSLQTFNNGVAVNAVMTELVRSSSPIPISVVIGTIDVAGLFALMIFFCLLGIGIAGAWELRKRIA